MMNVLALGLVLTSLVTAGFFSPTPEKNNPKEDVIVVKEGHRVVVVEYDQKDDHVNTKVLISPQDSHKTVVDDDDKGHIITDAKDKLSEKIEDTKEIIIDAKDKSFSPKELVCDAYGKCKEKIASAIGKTKDTAAEKVYAAEEGAKEAVGKAKEKVSEKVEGAKETASDKAKEAEQMIEKASDKVKEGAKEGQKELGEIFRHAREVVGDVLAYVASPERLAPVTGVLHLMGFAAAYGICVWVTFASSYVLAGALPKQQFAMVQSRIYPVYFKSMAYGVGAALLGHLMNQRKSLWPIGVGMFQGFNLMASLAMIFVNLMYLEPRATKVMIARMKKEKEEGRGKEGHTIETRAGVVDSTAETAGRGTTTATTTTTTTYVATPEEMAAKSEIKRLSQTLERLNSYSSSLNVLTLVSLTWHLVHLGQHLHSMC
ncbi:hypothetical protein BUALT_Bualt08G0140600 [Buddleja alternifolia]|uniref:TMEM205-like domain-containing protein n=1 Tax=Buddleja alternifolia TaxID=168488 RepID=A0AAV6X6M8_9LAMI|nr:hypothetical protein BUALT_Bualt08G0140600 [Buddleja alternifolia]